MSAPTRAASWRDADADRQLFRARALALFAEYTRTPYGSIRRVALWTEVVAANAAWDRARAHADALAPQHGRMPA